MFAWNFENVYLFYNYDTRNLKASSVQTLLFTTFLCNTYIFSNPENIHYEEALLYIKDQSDRAKLINFRMWCPFFFLDEQWVNTA